MVLRGIEETVTVTHDLSSKRNAAPGLFWVAKDVAPTSLAGQKRGTTIGPISALFATQMVQFIQKCYERDFDLLDFISKPAYRA